ncbi:hydroxymethylbilane synthase [Methylacidimicrobium cyclopophantes]|uniref:Hydroxymethylbilane synthase n=1 Tax=Methylacidimicrobium cyclopophantes TaxID=1041766 RepID=A0A5E6MC60_9BACT|nr:hydroxymethylbilane synthase [Methylacidimicrobium cyclopophantes]VVM06809.1 hydroxymethylbilane synthase [Methylacidimicrobium cyclopophantes]
MMRSLVIGSRRSGLARVQAEWVKNTLEGSSTGRSFTIAFLETSGDRWSERGEKTLPGRGIFTKELESALLRREIDIAVHSLKDLATELPEGLTLAAVSPREDARDVWVSRSFPHWEAVPAGSTVAAGSPRRVRQLQELRPDFSFCEIRGNVDTRLRKVEANPDWAGTVLAAAGLKRLGLFNRELHFSFFSFEVLLPAPGQGALGIEARAEDKEAVGLLRLLHDEGAGWEVAAERAFLRSLGGGCRSAVGAKATVERHELVLEGIVWVEALGRNYRRRIVGPAREAESLGRALAEKLLSETGSAHGGDKEIE